MKTCRTTNDLLDVELNCFGSFRAGNFDPIAVALASERREA